MTNSPESCRQGIFSLSKAGVSSGHAVFLWRGSRSGDQKRLFSDLLQWCQLQWQSHVCLIDWGWICQSICFCFLVRYWVSSHFYQKKLKVQFWCFAFRISGCSSWLTHWGEGSSNLLSFLQHLHFKCSCPLSITYTDVIVLLSKSDSSSSCSKWSVN